jgi:hypothetical protein
MLVGDEATKKKSNGGNHAGGAADELPHTKRHTDGCYDPVVNMLLTEC